MMDRDLRERVQQALDWEPSIDASEVGVTVDGGVVTLRGDVHSYSQKEAAERVALRTYGVRGVANDLKVRLATGFERTDSEVAQEAVSALKWNTLVPRDKVTVTVTDGWITLKGTVLWQFEKEAAARAVRDLTGVKGVSNLIAVQPSVKVADVRDKIEAAFERSAEIDARRIRVTASDGKVVLAGNVRSWAERREAERAAWAAPGVTQVEDHLAVVP